MKDLGKKYEAMPMKSEAKDIYYPRVSIDKEQLPSLDGKKVGDKVNIEFEAEIVGIYKSENESQKVDEITLELKKAECDEEDDVKPTGKVLEKIKEMLK